MISPSIFMTLYFLLMNKYWQDVIQNAIGCAIGSAVAIAISFIIYWLTIRYTENAARKAVAEKENDQLEAFATMVGEAKRMITAQIKSIDEFIEALKLQPVKFPLIVINPIGSLKRVIDSITFEGAGLAYKKKYKGQNSLIEFTKILNLIDYFFYVFIDLQEMVKRASLNHDDRKFKVGRVFDDTNRPVIKYLTLIPEIDPLKRSLVEIKVKFEKERGSLDQIEPINTLFFEPIVDLTKRYLVAGTAGEFIVDLHLNASKGAEYYTQLGIGYKQFEDEVWGIAKTAKENLLMLEGFSEKILIGYPLTYGKSVGISTTEAKTA